VTSAAILFDLDGTLIDTAPDMVGALYALCDEAGSERPAYELARAQIANGGAGLIELAFPALGERARRDRLEAFLAGYERRIADASALFPGMDTVLDTLDAGGVPWGIVTNKPERLTLLLLDGLGLRDRSACAIGGDTLAVRKPDPAPLHHAARLLDANPAASVYLGDHRRDIEAGAAAGMRTIGVRYGYLLQGDEPESWGADALIDHADELPAALDSLAFAYPGRAERAS
jgi:phosphoglycolate phosphatase